MPTIGAEPTEEGIAYDIASARRIVGQSETAVPGEFRASYWKESSQGAEDWTVTNLGTLLDGGTSLARGKNKFDDIVGWSLDAGGDQRAVIWEPVQGMPGTWTLTDLPTLAGDSFAYDVSDSKVVVGWSQTSGGERHAVKWEYVAGSWTVMDIMDTDLFGGNLSEAYAVNLAGDIVGKARTGSTPKTEHAFLWSNGVMYDLDSKTCKYIISTDTSWVLREAWDITDLGAIAGWGLRNGFNTPKPYVLTPLDISVADITGPEGDPDGCVDSYDLTALLGAWCSAVNDPNPPSPPCENCSEANLCLADIAGPGGGPPDGCVDSTDLTKMLGEWCSEAGGNPCGTCGGEGAQGGGGSGSGPSLTAALAQIGFGSVGAYQAHITTAGDAEAFASANVLLGILESHP
ncbi:MAG: hypothetical protein IH889_05320 [Planctomycetes bacterium]|nr:hypothetical protein [Planctomycetota bacterium]